MLRCISSKSTSLFISFTSDRQWVHLNLNLHWIFFFSSCIVEPIAARAADAVCVRVPAGSWRGCEVCGSPQLGKTDDSGRPGFSAASQPPLCSPDQGGFPQAAQSHSLHTVSWCGVFHLHLYTSGEKNYRKTLSFLTTTLIFFFNDFLNKFIDGLNLHSDPGTL